MSRAAPSPVTADATSHVDASASSFELRVRLARAPFVLDVDVTSRARALGVFGPSGSGKTSLLEAVAGWREPQSACVRIGGHVLIDDDVGVRRPIEARGVGYVPQDALLFPHWNVRRNVTAGAPRGVDANLFERTIDVLEIRSLLDRSVTGLSGGEAQRVALARALLSRPGVLLLDEPLGSLDVPLRRRVLPYLIRVRAEFDVPTIFVSHDATEVQALCDDVVVLQQGRVVAQGRPDDVLRRAWAETGEFDNVLAGVVSSATHETALVRVDGVDVCVPGANLRAGERALIAIGSEEILVARDVPTRISARNVIRARVESLEPTRDGALRLETRLAGASSGHAATRVSVSLTRAAAQELELVPGLDVHLVFKTSSCRVLSASADRTARGNDGSRVA